MVLLRTLQGEELLVIEADAADSTPSRLFYRPCYIHHE
jgi:hypothetical protein